jgi:hypothetical protein
VTRSVGGAVAPWSRAEQRISCRRWRLTAAAAVLAAGLTACGDDGESEHGGTDVSDEAGTRLATPAGRSREPILIKTRITGFKGEVLAGSTIGDARFCPGGSVRHERGSLEIGFPAINVFRCAHGQLRIGFGPGPDQMNRSVQTSYWEILDGSGRFAGIRGDGRMTVRFVRAGSSRGEETFRGHVVVP